MHFERIFHLSVDDVVISCTGLSENTHVLSYADLPYIDTFYYKNFKKGHLHKYFHQSYQKVQENICHLLE